MRLTVYFPEESPTTHEFVGQKLAIGRLRDNDVQIDDGSVSSRHAEIELGVGGAVVRDLESTNGTFLNGEQLTGEQALAEGDEIYFGNIRAVFMEPVAAAAGPAETDTVPVTISQDGGTPGNFRYMSPLPQPQAARDRLGVAAWACAALGLLAAGYALFAVLTA